MVINILPKNWFRTLSFNHTLDIFYDETHALLFLLLSILDIMISNVCIVLIALSLLHYTSKFYLFPIIYWIEIFFFFLLESLQTGYTCEPSITLTCSDSDKIIILEVIYSSECPKLSEESNNGTSLYAPSRCIGYDRERTSNTCNGKQTCIIDNSPEQRPSFLASKQANCAFKGQSINIEYSCIPGKMIKA